MIGIIVRGPSVEHVKSWMQKVFIPPHPLSYNFPAPTISYFNPLAFLDVGFDKLQILEDLLKVPHNKLLSNSKLYDKNTLASNIITNIGYGYIYTMPKLLLNLYNLYSNFDIVRRIDLVASMGNLELSFFSSTEEGTSVCYQNNSNNSVMISSAAADFARLIQQQIVIKPEITVELLTISSDGNPQLYSIQLNKMEAQ